MTEQQVNKILEIIQWRLTPREKAILGETLGYTKFEKPKDVATISKEYHLTLERVREIHRKTISMISKLSKVK